MSEMINARAERRLLPLRCHSSAAHLHSQALASWASVRAVQVSADLKINRFEDLLESEPFGAFISDALV